MSHCSCFKVQGPGSRVQSPDQERERQAALADSGDDREAGHAHCRSRLLTPLLCLPVMRCPILA
eukprot:643845-Rhodomonas_salina.1